MPNLNEASIKDNVIWQLRECELKFEIEEWHLLIQLLVCGHLVQTRAILSFFVFVHI
jgi:hypothetical protein